MEAKLLVLPFLSPSAAPLAPPTVGRALWVAQGATMKRSVLARGDAGGGT
jgi:hypothetical protein